MAKIPRDSNLFNNIVKCFRKVTRVELDKYGRADPIQKFVNKTTDEMTQDICSLMDEVTNNLDSMYSEIKHIFNYYNTEMEKIATKFHDKNACQNDPGKLQAELVKSVTDLNIKAESLKSDLQAHQSEFQKYIHDYILTLQEKSQRNYQILNNLKMKQPNLTDKEDDSESTKDMIDNFSKSNSLQFTSTSMSSNGIFSSVDSHIPSFNKETENQSKSKFDLENTSKNLEEICKKLKTSKNLEHKSELTSETNSSNLSKKIESSNNNLSETESGKKSQTNNAKKSDNDIPISKQGSVVSQVDKKETREQKSENIFKASKTENDDGRKLLKENDEAKAQNSPQKSKSDVEISRVKGLENIPNQMGKKFNELNLLSQTQSLNAENEKDLISRTSCLPFDPNDTNKLFEYQNKLSTKIAHFSTSDPYLNRKIPWYPQSNTNFQSSTNENVTLPCGSPPTTTAPQPPPTCYSAVPPPTPTSPCEADFCNDPCNPCEKDESHGSVKYDLFEAYLCSKPQATRYMDYLDSVRNGLRDQNPNGGVCNQYIMSHTEFLEAIDTRKKLLRSIEKHRELQVECLEPSTLAKLKAIVTCKLGRLKSCSGVAKPGTQEQQLQPHHHYNRASSQSAADQPVYLESQQNIKSVPAGGQVNDQSYSSSAHPAIATPTTTALPYSSQVNAQSEIPEIPEHDNYSKDQPTIQKQNTYLEKQPVTSSEPQHIATQNTHFPSAIHPGLYSQAQSSANQHQHQSSVKQEIQYATGNEQYKSHAEPAVRQESHVHLATTKGYNDAGVQSNERQCTYEGQLDTTQGQYSHSQSPQVHFGGKSESYTHSEVQSIPKNEYNNAGVQSDGRHYSYEGQPGARQGQYSYSQSPPEMKQKHHSPLESQQNVSHTHSEAQTTATSGYNYAGVQSDGRQYNYTAQASGKEGQYSQSPQEINQKQDQYANYDTHYTKKQEHAETQHKIPQHQHRYSNEQPATTQGHQKTSTTCSTAKPLPETQHDAIREPYNHLEIQSENKLEPTPSQPTPSDGLHSQTSDPFIYPEMRPFEPKPSSVRQHIEQKMAEAAKPIIETPNTLKPVKQNYHRANLSNQISETSFATPKVTTVSSKTSLNSNEGYNPNLPQMPKSNMYTKHPQTALGSKRRFITKLQGNKNSLSVTPTKRYQIRSKEKEH